MCLTLVIGIMMVVVAQPKVAKDANGYAVSVTNQYDYAITIKLFYDDGSQQSVEIQPGETFDNIPQNCKSMTCNGKDMSGIFYRKRIVEPSAPAGNETHEANESAKEKPNVTENNREKPKQEESDPVNESKSQPQIAETAIETVPVEYVGWRKKSTIMQDFEDFLERTSYYSLAKIQQESDDVDKSINQLQMGTEGSESYVEALRRDTATMVSNLEGNRRYQEKFVDDFLGHYSNNSREKAELREQMLGVLNERHDMHEANLIRLENALDDWMANNGKTNWPLWALIAGLCAIFTGLAIWFVKAKKRTPDRRVDVRAYEPQSGTASSRDIVVRRKTTSILKKQSLENVVGSPVYLALNCAEFCQESAVRRIYIKNTCIKDIYNLYAEDLRNPENPKEDGCMVLGRWVHDKENNEYYVSLEDVVMPGDDAVFSEYELNFGGKIKLKVSEKLRKLRRETGLQYDMTCWVHSHPGLGVFFSNQDNTVHMQLRHPSHPHFLVAMVIDILTPQQELGIFTFKPDGTINSKADLTQMYSLEEMYKWAIESERNTFKREDHYDTLAGAKQHENACHGVHLSNSAIIDIDKLTVEHENGMAGMVHGFVQHEGNYSEIAVSIICQQETIPDNELVGCFIITKYCSIPTIRKSIETHVGKIRFVLVYSTSDGMLTTIPIRDRELITDEIYYGEQKLEDLKIWTRRKR